MNLAFILESSFNSGGIERMLTTIANAMSEVHNVSAITAFNEGRKDFFPFNEKVKRIDLCIVRNNYKKRTKLKNEYKERLGHWLKENPQDIVISLGSLEFFFLPYINDGSKKIFWFHFAFNYDIMTSRQSSNKLINVLIGKVKRMRRIKIAKKYDTVVVLSKKDYESWHKYLNNVTFIYNPITISPQPVIDYGIKRAIAVGRIEYQKGFDYLVQAWAITNRKFPDWKLDIYGGGATKEIEYLQSIINRYNLQGIVNLKGRTDNITKAYSEHSFMILSSRYEGFALVLVEAAACGLPLISFDCEQGPSEIIEDGRNGYLVSPVGNVEELARKIMILMNSLKKRKAMGRVAFKMSAHYGIPNIKREWLNLFESMNKRT